MTLTALTQDGLNAPIAAGDAVTKKLHKLGLRRQFDLVLHMPIRYEDETHLYTIKEAFLAGRGQAILLEGIVTLCEVNFKPRRQLVAKIEDESGSLALRFLHFYPNLQTQLLVGKRVRVLGEVKQGYYGLEMIHPKLREVGIASPLARSLTPVYSTVSGLTQPVLRRLIHKTLETLSLVETVPTQALRKMQLISFAEAVGTLHLPPAHYSVATLNHQTHPAWQRLKFDELLAQQLSMRMAYQTRRQGHAPS
ncbi:MAG: ATP-dependent DNA helicase RecG, partial [Neisseriaceae bacterium]|nr:ATP-dependent DNA helicase RecG [Neisseriaceae bacterium]